SSLISLMFTFLTTVDSFFSIEIISLGPLHQYFLQGVVYHRPFVAVGIITGITSRPAAARIIGDHVINEILVASIAELVRFTGLKKEGVARPDFSHFILVAHTAASRDNKIKLRFSRVRVIWAKRFPHITRTRLKRSFILLSLDAAVCATRMK